MHREPIYPAVEPHDCDQWAARPLPRTPTQSRRHRAPRVLSASCKSPHLNPGHTAHATSSTLTAPRSSGPKPLLCPCSSRSGRALRGVLVAVGFLRPRSGFPLTLLPLLPLPNPMSDTLPEYSCTSVQPPGYRPDPSHQPPHLVTSRQCPAPCVYCSQHTGSGWACVKWGPFVRSTDC